jgi:hypothetical protein
MISPSSQTFGHIIGRRRQAEIHRDHGRLITSHLRHGFFPIAGNHCFVLVESPAHLLLQCRIVLDDQQCSAFLAHIP